MEPRSELECCVVVDSCVIGLFILRGPKLSVLARNEVVSASCGRHSTTPLLHRMLEKWLTTTITTGFCDGTRRPLVHKIEGIARGRTNISPPSTEVSVIQQWISYTLNQPHIVLQFVLSQTPLPVTPYESKRAHTPYASQSQIQTSLFPPPMNSSPLSLNSKFLYSDGDSRPFLRRILVLNQ